jgi:hypothetical protein
MAVKSLVNDDVEIVGLDEADDDVEEDDAPPLELELVLELDFELPHPAATAHTTTSNVHTRKRLKLITARSSQLARNLMNSKSRASPHHPYNAGPAPAHDYSVRHSLPRPP